MGDVAQILKGVEAPAPSTEQKRDTSTSLKLTGMPREILNLISGTPSNTNKKQSTSSLENSSTSLPPITAGSAIHRGSSKKKIKLNKTPARKWVWAPFTSSARNDGLILSHFVRSGVEYPDYPYARFDVHMEALHYSDQEYETYLKESNWSKSETDRLMELCKIFELRWPVIHDRWIGSDSSVCNHKTLEELQYRYYNIASILTQQRVDEAASNMANQGHDTTTVSAASESVVIQSLGTGSTNKQVFNLQKEVERKKQLETLWNRTKEEQEEEEMIRQQLKIVEAQIRKLKKAGMTGNSNPTAQPIASPTMTSVITTKPQHLSTSTNVDNITTPIVNQIESYFASSAPVPSPGIPYLQSQRMNTPATGGALGLSKSIMSKMEATLKELNVPTLKTPTKRVCDVYDAVRRFSLTIIMLQKVVHKKEMEVMNKKLKLNKILATKNTPPAPNPEPAVTQTPAISIKANHTKTTPAGSTTITIGGTMASATASPQAPTPVKKETTQVKKDTTKKVSRKRTKKEGGEQKPRKRKSKAAQAANPPQTPMVSNTNVTTATPVTNVIKQPTQNVIPK